MTDYKYANLTVLNAILSYAIRRMLHFGVKHFLVTQRNLSKFYYINVQNEYFGSI